MLVHHGEFAQLPRRCFSARSCLRARSSIAPLAVFALVGQAFSTQSICTVGCPRTPHVVLMWSRALLFGSLLSATPTAVRGVRNKAMQAPPAVVLNASPGHHSATVIFFHGLGDSGNGWAPVFEEIREPHIKYILPHAPSMAVTLNMGMMMPAWYDLTGLSAHDAEDEAGILKATALAHSLIDHEVKAGIPLEKIVIGGFSMGGALALYAGLTHKPLGGIIGLSCWLPLRAHFPAGAHTPVLMGHGDSDALVAPAIGHQSAQLLEGMGAKVKFLTYRRMGHSVNDQEIADVRHFLKERLPKP